MVCHCPGVAELEPAAEEQFPLVPLGGWVQIELLETAPSIRGKGVGKLLLALALACAVLRDSKKSALLFIAGPGREVNPTADGLYKKFGFVHPPEGYMLNDASNLRVLWNMSESLRDLAERQGLGAPVEQKAVGEAEGRSIRELQSFLEDRGIGWRDCVERRELEQRVRSVAESAPPGSPGLEAPEGRTQFLLSLTVRELKQRLTDIGVGYEGCLEKQDLVARLAAVTNSH
eukprot:Hpha_TRINITY_DN953_c0_g1::TRINITY_DN953_c0_g1_i1::g.156209::m.156209